MNLVEKYSEKHEKIEKKNHKSPEMLADESWSVRRKL